LNYRDLEENQFFWNNQNKSKNINQNTCEQAEARRLIEQGGVFLNEQRVVDVIARVVDVIGTTATLMMRAGKKKRISIKIV
jgi:tyrosyl-tRNA synthetase